MERVSIRPQNLDELYQTPENTLESKFALLRFVLAHYFCNIANLS